jgi:hypothetical protein
MTQLRKGSFIRRAKDITIGSALALTFLSGTTFISGCSTNNNESEYSYEETTYSKGVRSHIKEINPGEFSITAEEAVEDGKSVAIVSYLDGHTDTLSATAAKALIDQEIQTNHASVGHHNGLSSMLLYGGMGYMLGRSMNNGYMNSYRAQGNASRFYSSPSTFAQSQNAFRDVNASRSTRTVQGRPSDGKSGFFNRSSGSVGG